MCVWRSRILKPGVLNAVSFLKKRIDENFCKQNIFIQSRFKFRKVKLIRMYDKKAKRPFPSRSNRKMIFKALGSKLML